MIRGALALAAALVLAIAAAGCGSSYDDDSNETAGPPVGGLVAGLRDEISARPGSRIAWSTHWRLCWDAYPRAAAYELETLTGEGASPDLRSQRGRCLELEAVSGENKRSEGLRNRRVLLALQGGQLAYRVRAVLEDDRVSEWSRAISVGSTTPS